MPDPAAEEQFARRAGYSERSIGRLRRARNTPPAGRMWFFISLAGVNAGNLLTQLLRPHLGKGRAFGVGLSVIILLPLVAGTALYLHQRHLRNRIDT